MHWRPSMIRTISASWLITNFSRSGSNFLSNWVLVDCASKFWSYYCLATDLLLASISFWAWFLNLLRAYFLELEKKVTSHLLRSPQKQSINFSIWFLNSSLKESFSFVNFLMYGTNISTNLTNFDLTKLTSHLSPFMIESMSVGLLRMAAHFCFWSSIGSLPSLTFPRKLQSFKMRSRILIILTCMA